MTFKSLAAIAALACTATAQAAIPVSGSMSLLGVASIQNGAITGPGVASTDSWTTTPATLHIGSIVDAFNPQTRGYVSAIGLGTGIYGANYGTAKFIAYGFQYDARSGVDDGQHVSLNGAGPDWTYTFTATADGSFALLYDVAPDPDSGSLFGLNGWNIEWSGPGGGKILTDLFDPTVNGKMSRAVVAGQTYTAALRNNTNLNTAGHFGTATGRGATMHGNFAYSVIEGTVPEPATWALLIAGFGVTGAAARRRRAAVAA